MELYTKKKRSKLFLFILALIIIAGSIFFTNVLVQKFASEERKNVRLWADAVHRKARLVRYTESFFKQLQEQERQKVELLADVYKQILKDKPDEDLTIYVNVIANNKTIPIIITDANGKIISASNLEIKLDSNTYLAGKLKEEFSTYAPIEVPIARFNKQYLYYKDSRFFTELKAVLNDYISSFMSEVALNSSSVPVIITDSSKQNIIQFGNLNDIRMSDPVYVQKKLEEMASENTPIKVSFGEQGTSYIFYKDSELLTIMKFFPLAQILIIAVFLGIAYLLFSYSRRAEQNRVWAGMAKETAHQLGTPLSSIMAWIELLKMRAGTEEAANEIEKDIERLEVITERFSKIGSVPKLEENDLISIISKSIEYLKPRTPKKINYVVNIPDKEILLPVNGPLFSWVIENICKNAIDAMSGSGTITIQLKEEAKQVIIDFIDTGKGISITEQKAIFNPGYTRKKRGWGLGLSLTKRIIRDYHNGKIFVKSSVVGKGTTFRVILKKQID
ncbi:MAG: HAMP domain-containing histidine kinase [Bacteroidales bacterium]|nr:HAMP domain-containing histidine kinase [Bacteroidales bacterium]